MALPALKQKNTAAAAAYTEYQIVVPPGAMDITLALRPNASPANLFWYLATNNSAPGSAANLPAVYGTIPAGGARTITGKLGGQTIYFQTDQATQVAELDYHEDV